MTSALRLRSTRGRTSRCPITAADCQAGIPIGFLVTKIAHLIEWFAPSPNVRRLMLRQVVVIALKDEA
jgi:hypothetical protein